MPSWVYYSVWVLWAFFAVQESLVSYVLYKHNSNKFTVLLHGKMQRTNRGEFQFYAFLFFSVFWISFVVFGTK